jgi:uptake hydrogenase large subunit
MAPEGELTVALRCERGRVAAVGVSSTRRALPRQLVCDRPPHEVSQLLPRLFSICGNAQAAAAAGALDAAQDLTAPDGAIDQRRFAVNLEALLETLWRLLIDWPQAMDEPPLVAQVRMARDAAARLASGDGSLPTFFATWDRVAVEHVYGESAHTWLARDADALDAWIDQGACLPARLLRRLQSEMPDLGRSATPLMPAATLEAMQGALLPHLLDDAAYSLVPHWNGAAVETGAIARQSCEPLVAARIKRDGVTATTRFIARLVELAVLTESMRTRKLPLASARQHRLQPGHGIGLAETARGLLLHHAEVADGRVIRYDIVAPTEWNFHPQGPLSSLKDRPVAGDDELARQARILVRSLDPCISSRIEVTHA